MHMYIEHVHVHIHFTTTVGGSLRTFLHVRLRSEERDRPPLRGGAAHDAQARLPRRPHATARARTALARPMLTTTSFLDPNPTVSQ